MKKASALQTAIWIALGIGSFVFLKWRNDSIEVDAERLNPVVRGSGVSVTPLDSLPKPFEGIKSPIVVLPRILAPKRKPAPVRARAGDTIVVSLTAYCLNGSTRTGTTTREGIVAADPRVFPMNAELMISVSGKPAKRYRVEDTGLLIKGRAIDIWLPDCSEARSFGRKRGIVTLAPKIRR
jgi:3D (Asp-Asp-Asp) domain-containing protein